MAQNSPSGTSVRTPVRSTEAHSDLWESEPANRGAFFRNKPTPVKLLGKHSEAIGDYVSLTVGIEHWEQNKRQTHRRQVWKIDCRQPPAEREQPTTPSCTLIRTVIDEAVLGVLPIVTEHLHSVEDDTLRVGRISWQGGIIELSIVHTDKRTAEVTIRFSEKGGYYFFKDFTAATLLREKPSGAVTVVEYRIPEYTYHVNVPIEIPGLNDAGLRPWDELFAKLSKPDQEGWYALFADNGSGLAKLEEGMEKAVVAEMRKRFPTLKIDEKNANDIEYTEEQKSFLGQSATKYAREKFINMIQSSPRLSGQAKLLIVLYINTYFTLK